MQQHEAKTMLTRELIIDLLDSKALTSWFQPIFSRQSGEIVGYEALARVAEGLSAFQGIDIAALFAQAQRVGLISVLDMLCRENALRQAEELDFNKKNARLFLNICPATLMQPDHPMGLTDRVAEECGIPRERIVLEITEQEAIRDYGLFRRSIDHYRNRGYKIAIDDFGVGYGGLKMLSVIEPDFVKVDRHFINGLDRDSFKYNLVDAIATVCHKLGIVVIAEGIEREEELAMVSHFSIDLLQGYLLERPGPLLSCQVVAGAPTEEGGHPECSGSLVDACMLEKTARLVEPLSPGQSQFTAYQRFAKDVELQAIPVVEGERVVGIIHRMRFLEQMVGQYHYELSRRWLVRDLLEPDFLLVETTTPVEEVVRRIKVRRGRFLYEDICVTHSGKYLGMVSISSLLEAITNKSLQLAKGANPLSGLPGNEFIQRTVSRFINERVDFDVCYIDIDDFKPYNDYYGFERGDMVIRKLGEALVEIVRPDSGDRFRFVGHIGGDDFIVITRPNDSMAVCRRIITAFEALLPVLHGPREFMEGGYEATDRQGQLRRFSLLSLSIGIVCTEQSNVSSYGELAFFASEVKRAAKKQPGSAIVRERRACAGLNQPLSETSGAQAA